MNKILGFFNKIMGLMVFLIACMLLVFLIHVHHGRGSHHGMFPGYRWKHDSTALKMQDSVQRK